MFILQLSAQLVTTATGSVARVSDTTNWSQAISPRASWAIFLSAARLGSTLAQASDLPPLSYDPVLFQSGANPAGTVDIPLPGDGVYRLQAVAVPVLLSAAALVAATAGRLYYRADTDQFIHKVSAALNKVVTTWAQVLDAALTDNAAGTLDPRNLLEKSTDAYVLGDAALVLALAHLNLRYLQAAERPRRLLLEVYQQGELLLRGARLQVEQAYYSDAATVLLAAQRLLGGESGCQPGPAASAPAAARLTV